ncbi:peptidoglycan DD-metalloendopeptidase family protein [Vibrio hannami]|uniref:peptidoglycan DD-metalloendopeptidase family protein n=1 Tax=Vibrio hannami TaxID=2717094 RepID=UPI00240FA1E1|nr:peptidoglycan DD-metalloendopeptidase family protein [Vibrio hannami]MDG3087183.1 peptidoglycan DD-metalloendopeptidase family protein [Vibrio hannami]
MSKITITIPSSEGDKHFFVGRKTVLATLTTLVVSPLVAGYFVYQNQAQQTQSQETFSHLMAELGDKENSIVQLNSNIEQLSTDKLHLNRELEARDSQLLVLNKRVYDVEKVLGISDMNPEHSSVSTEEKQLEERVDAAAINSAVRATMFRLIPNDAPLSYNRVSSSFGRRLNPITNKRHFHTGIDLTCKKGEPIYAPADGVIETVRPSKKGFGNFLIVRHSFGFSTSYAHLHGFKAKQGQFVTKGDEIATCGNSGNSTGAHLHYEIRFLGRYLNPKTLMDWTPENFEKVFEKEKKVKWASLVNVIDNVVRLQVNLTNNPYVDTSISTASSTGLEEESKAQ